MLLLFIFIYPLSVMLYSSEVESKEVQFHTHDSSRAVYNAAGGTVNESGVTVNNFFGPTQLRQHPDIHASVEITETDDAQIRDSLFEFRRMPLEKRKIHENEIKVLYIQALETGDHSSILSKAKEKDPFAQIYWCMLTITAGVMSSRASTYLERGRRFFEIGEERKPIQRSGVFSLLSGFLSEHKVGKEKAKNHYFEASDTFEDAEAQFRLAMILHEKEEIEEAGKYYELSANQGNQRANIQLEKIRFIKELNASPLDEETKRLIILVYENTIDLKILSLSNLAIEDLGIKYLSKALRFNKRLENLNISWNYISEIGIHLIAEILETNSTLIVLNLYNNQIKNAGVLYLSNALRINCSLCSLNLSNCGIGDEGVSFLSDALRINSALAMLDLSYNEIEDQGASFLFDALIENSSLRQMHLNNNKMSTEGARSLVRMLASNRTLCKINIARNRVADSYKSSISQEERIEW